MQFFQKSLNAARVSSFMRPSFQTSMLSAMAAGNRNFSGQQQTFVQRLENIKSEALMGGGQARIDKQHSNNKLTARERLELLFDEGTFVEYDQLKTHRCNLFGMEKQKIYGDGVVTGQGMVNGKVTFAFS